MVYKHKFYDAPYVCKRFFPLGDQYNIRLNFGRGWSIFLGEFSEIIGISLPNIFGKPRRGKVYPGGSTFKGGGEGLLN